MAAVASLRKNLSENEQVEKSEQAIIVYNKAGQLLSIQDTHKPFILICF